MTSFLEAAIIILKEKAEPLTVGEITEIGLQKGLIKSSGKTPASTMYSQIYRDIKKYKNKSAFIKIRRGYFSLH